MLIFSPLGEYHLDVFFACIIFCLLQGGQPDECSLSAGTVTVHDIMLIIQAALYQRIEIESSTGIFQPLRG